MFVGTFKVLDTSAGHSQHPVGLHVLSGYWLPICLAVGLLVSSTCVVSTFIKELDTRRPTRAFKVLDSQ